MDCTISHTLQSRVFLRTRSLAIRRTEKSLEMFISMADDVLKVRTINL